MTSSLKNLLWAPSPSDPPHLRVGIGGDIPVLPPLASALFVGNGFAMQTLTGIQGSVPFSSTVRYVIAAALIVCGVVLKKKCDAALKEAGTKASFAPVPSVADTGPYAFCRNPMCWALMVLVLAIGIVADTAWVAIGSNVLLWLYLHWIVVPAEETFLQQELGDSYKKYSASTKRWGPF